MEQLEGVPREGRYHATSEDLIFENQLYTTFRISSKPCIVNVGFIYSPV